MCVSFPLQVSLRETSSAQRSLESQLMGARSDESTRDFRLQEMEGRMSALESENEMLRHKVSAGAPESDRAVT